MSRWMAAATSLTAVLVLVACNGEDDSAGTAPPSTSGTVSAPPTAASTSPTSSPDTSAPTTSPAPTTSASEVPTTATVDRTAATKEAVAAAVVAIRPAYNYAVRNYDAPDVLEVLARTTVVDGPSWALTISNLEDLRSNGWLVRDHPSVTDATMVEGAVELLDGPPATRAQVVVCTISSGVVYAPGAAPDGSDLIINDDVVARRSRATMVLDGGSWKLLEGEALGAWTGETTCPVV